MRIAGARMLLTDALESSTSARCGAGDFSFKIDIVRIRSFMSNLSDYGCNSRASSELLQLREECMEGVESQSSKQPDIRAPK